MITFTSRFCQNTGSFSDSLSGWWILIVSSSFWLSTFTKCMDAVLAPLRLQFELQEGYTFSISKKKKKFWEPRNEGNSSHVANWKRNSSHWKQFTLQAIQLPINCIDPGYIKDLNGHHFSLPHTFGWSFCWKTSSGVLFLVRCLMRHKTKKVCIWYVLSILWESTSTAQASDVSPLSFCLIWWL